MDAIKINWNKSTSQITSSNQILEQRGSWIFHEGSEVAKKMGNTAQEQEHHHLLGVLRACKLLQASFNDVQQRERRAW